MASPFGVIGSRIRAPGWASAAEVASLIRDAGWAWAGLAVAAGALAGARARGAVAAVLALIAATTAYYGLDALLRQEPFAWYVPELLLWWLASAVCGSALGAVGAQIRGSRVVGLLAGLTVPVGATVQMIFLPPGSGAPIVTPAMTWARLIVWAAAAVAAGLVVTRFLVVRKQ